MLRIKQANDLNFFTVPPTLPLLPFPIMSKVFMKFRGRNAHHNRLRNAEISKCSLSCPAGGLPALPRAGREGLQQVAHVTGRRRVDRQRLSGTRMNELEMGRMEGNAVDAPLQCFPSVIPSGLR